MKCPCSTRSSKGREQSRSGWRCFQCSSGCRPKSTLRPRSSGSESAVAVCAVGVVESITVTITDAGPTSAWVGFPVIVPDVALIVNPLGSPVALKRVGCCAAGCCHRATVRRPHCSRRQGRGRDGQRARLSRADRQAQSRCCGLGGRLREIGHGDGYVRRSGVLWFGVPEMVPVVALIASPLGNPVALKVKGDEPPVTVIVAL